MEQNKVMPVTDAEERTMERKQFKKIKNVMIDRKMEINKKIEVVANK